MSRIGLFGGIAAAFAAVIVIAYEVKTRVVPPIGAPNPNAAKPDNAGSVVQQIDTGLKDVESTMGIPYDSLLAVMFAESGLKPDARNPADGSKAPVAVGLIQLTKGANLLGFHTSDDLSGVLSMSVKEQFDKVVKPYYERIPSAKGASPGKLRMLNFLPSHANESQDFVLASDGDAIYTSNRGFDSDHKGYITVGDVYRNTENALTSAKKKLANELQS